MKVLLDTHTFLWFIAGDAQLDGYARQLIEDLSNERYLSMASLWEITIKSSLGRLTVPTPPSTLVREHAWANAMCMLSGHRHGAGNRNGVSVTAEEAPASWPPA